MHVFTTQPTFLVLCFDHLRIGFTRDQLLIETVEHPLGFSKVPTKSNQLVAVAHIQRSREKKHKKSHVPSPSGFPFQFLSFPPRQQTRVYGKFVESLHGKRPGQDDRNNTSLISPNYVSVMILVGSRQDRHSTSFLNTCAPFIAWC
jgi:hypothetical protein